MGWWQNIILNLTAEVLSRMNFVSVILLYYTLGIWSPLQASWKSQWVLRPITGGVGRGKGKGYMTQWMSLGNVLVMCTGSNGEGEIGWRNWDMNTKGEYSDGNVYFIAVPLPSPPPALVFQFHDLFHPLIRLCLYFCHTISSKYLTTCRVANGKQM